MLKRCPFRMSIRISCRNIEIIQNTSLFYKVLRNRNYLSNFNKEFGNYITPSLLIKV
jgi:hypothetical protein